LQKKTLHHTGFEAVVVLIFCGVLKSYFLGMLESELDTLAFFMGVAFGTCFGVFYSDARRLCRLFMSDIFDKVFVCQVLVSGQVLAPLETL